MHGRQGRPAVFRRYADGNDAGQQGQAEAEEQAEEEEGQQQWQQQ